MIVTFTVFYTLIVSTFWLVCFIILKKRKRRINFDTELGNLGISVVIAAKNEYNNLKKNIEAWLNLLYPNYQIIIVINNSSDGSLELIQNIENPKIKLIHLENTPKNWSPKKYALTQGILNADYEYIVFTDADCKPQSSEWLNYYNDSFQKGNEIVIGLSPYKKITKWWNGLLQWETFYTAFLYSLSGMIQSPYMCVGRNWGIKKEIFFKEGGYESHKNVLSGDDDLFIQYLKNSYQIDVLLEPNSQTLSEPPTNFYDYIHQKKRHLSASKYYRFRTKLCLFILNFMHLMYYFWLFYLFGFWKFKNLFLTLCLMKIFQITTLNQFSKNTKFIVPFFYKLMGDIILPLFQIVILPFSYFTRNSWK